MQCDARAHDEHVDDVSGHTYIPTYICKYSDFLVEMISVGLASARPNYVGNTVEQISYTKFLRKNRAQRSVNDSWEANHVSY